MPTFVMATRLEHGALQSPGALEALEKRVMEHIRASGEQTEIEWKGSFAVMGPYDYIDLFEAPDTETAMRVSTIVRTTGHAHTEVWPAVPWDSFKEMLAALPNR
jgi:uncharacterized protein with GYD domain